MSSSERRSGRLQEVTAGRPRRKPRAAALLVGTIIGAGSGLGLGTAGAVEVFGRQTPTLTEIAGSATGSTGQIDVRNGTFVPVGDSLAVGVGGTGQESWVGPVVDRLNSPSSKGAKKLSVSGLAKSGSSIDELNVRLEAQKEQLATVPNLILGVSAENKSVEKFLVDVQSLKKPNSRKIKDLLMENISKYSKSLERTREILASLQAERNNVLSREESKLQVVAISLPRIDEVPRVREELIDTGMVKKEQVRLVAVIFNYFLRRAMIIGNQAKNPSRAASYAYVDLTRRAVKPTEVSRIDGFHPNDDGYAAIAEESLRVMSGKPVGKA